MYGIAFLVFLGLCGLGIIILASFAFCNSGTQARCDEKNEALREEGRKFRLHALAASEPGPCNPVAKGADCDDCPGFCIQTVGETKDENYYKRQMRARDWLKECGLSL